MTKLAQRGCSEVRHGYSPRLHGACHRYIPHARGWTVKGTGRNLLSRQPRAGHISKRGEASKANLFV